MKNLQELRTTEATRPLCNGLGCREWLRRFRCVHWFYLQWLDIKSQRVVIGGGIRISQTELTPTEEHGVLKSKIVLVAGVVVRVAGIYSWPEWWPEEQECTRDRSNGQRSRGILMAGVVASEALDNRGRSGGQRSCGILMAGVMARGVVARHLLATGLAAFPPLARGLLARGEKAKG